LNHPDNGLLTATQLARLQSAFHAGAAEASEALAAWIGRSSVIEIDALEQIPLEQATGLLAASDEPICFCAVEIRGQLSGEMILAFDDASGFALADMLLDQSAGATQTWSELATSAALETTNILCCAYLNSLSKTFCQVVASCELLPSPPTFSRDFAESLLEFALMGQAMASDFVILARTRFEIDAAAVKWTLLFVPDADSMMALPQLLAPTPLRQEDH
jgi:chemotaxis protein CheC